MKLLQLDIKGYRSLYDVSWSPGNLNVVIGPNGSGKSNLLKVLDLLSLSARGGLGDKIRQEGGMEPVVWDGRTAKVDFRLKTTPVGQDRSADSDNLTYLLELARLGVSSAYRIEREKLAKYHWVETGQDNIPENFLDRLPGSAIIFDEHDYPRHIRLPIEEITEEETLLSSAAGPSSPSPTIKEFNRYLASWRIHQEFQTHSAAAVRQSPVTRRETTVSVDGSNLIQVLHTLYTQNQEFEHDLNLAMRAAFGDDFDKIIFPPASDQRIQLRLRWKSLKREQSAADLSDGMLRFLYLIAILANPEPPPLIAIDEPETGLHPSMLPIIAEYAAQAALRTQVIFTTHSAEFLSAFDRPPVTTVARWEEGKTVLQTISGETLDYWLKEYTLGKLYLSGELEGMA
jgi:predicted ATPase